MDIRLVIGVQAGEAVSAGQSRFSQQMRESLTCLPTAHGHAEIRIPAAAVSGLPRWTRCGSMCRWGFQSLRMPLPSQPLTHGDGAIPQPMRSRRRCPSTLRSGRAGASWSSSPRSASTATASPSAPRREVAEGQGAKTARSHSSTDCWAKSHLKIACCSGSSSPTDAGASAPLVGTRRTQRTSRCSCPPEGTEVTASARRNGFSLPFHRPATCASTAPGRRQGSLRRRPSSPQTNSSKPLVACSNCGRRRESSTSNQTPRRCSCPRMGGS